MTTIREFVKNNIGGKYDADGKYGFQCVDLIYFYLKEVFGKNRNTNKLLGYAKYNYQNIVKYGFSSIKYDGKNRPKRGDVISFIPEKANGNAGHVGICLAYDEEAKQVYVLEQNGGRNSSTGTGPDAIRIQKINFSKMLGWGRYNNISSKIEEDLFDKIVFEKGIYVWEATNYLEKRNVAIKTFYFLASYKSNLNGKNFNYIWGKGTGATTRQDLAIMIYKFLVNVLGKTLNLNELIKKGIWNGQNGNSQVSAEEFSFMINKTKEVYNLK